MSLISLGYIFTYYFLLISSYSLSHFFSRQALRSSSVVSSAYCCLSEEGRPSSLDFKTVRETLRLIRLLSNLVLVMHTSCVIHRDNAHVTKINF
ncbi:hypothetical protein HUB92_02325 [Wolbachia endosymbiont of Wiebesia pumilae]|uniref:hypothetical protein n=1 Tax=Wolbachia endosymbiont of Wiebesia pumilae TaxID=2742717 RepID=UPI001AE3A715|nr:hypothetical protein [Wolbachia endosymbiont of Wiebesia pumilae]QTP61771.1 hypothetical protein HUB92_02325 [Wolbachia endosymbiont of Wiebesia pumilae]